MKVNKVGWFKTGRMRKTFKNKCDDLDYPWIKEEITHGK